MEKEEKTLKTTVKPFCIDFEALSVNFVYMVKFILSRASLVAQLVKNPPAIQETLLRFLGRKNPLEKGKVTHSSILAWRI